MKKLFWTIITITVILVLWWLWQQGGGLGNLPQLPGVSEEDTTTRIQQDLEQLDLGDINQEFQSIDVDLNSL